MVKHFRSQTASLDFTMHPTDPRANILERMERAVEKVRERLLRAATALEGAGIPYAVIGGNAVAAWVATGAEAAVRNTRDVDILLERNDFPGAKRALEAAGFTHRHTAGVELFLDSPSGKVRDAVHVIFGGEKVLPQYDAPAPNSSESELFPEGLRVLSLDALVRMKLTSFRRKDQVHLLDMIEVGLIGEHTLRTLPGPLAERLKELLENPEG